MVVAVVLLLVLSPPLLLLFPPLPFLLFSLLLLLLLVPVVLPVRHAVLQLVSGDSTSNGSEDSCDESAGKFMQYLFRGGCRGNIPKHTRA